MTQSEPVEIDCPGCEQRHLDDYACGPTRQLLKAMRDRAAGYTMPTLDFDAPMPLPAAMEGLADTLLSQLVILGGTIDVAGIKRPLVVLTGRDQNGHAVPRWLYVDTEQGIAESRNLFDRMSSKAIDAARQARRGGGR